MPNSSGYRSRKRNISLSLKGMLMVKQARRRGHHQSGVSSIEYALIASLIAVAIIGGLQAAGSANGGLWGTWTSRFAAAVNGVLGLL